METDKAVGARASRIVWPVLIGSWFVSYFFARFLLKESGAFGLALSPTGPSWVRILIAIVPLIPAALALVLFIREIRSADELEVRMHLEALGIAFPLTLMMLMTLGMFELAVDLNPEDWSYRHVWMYPLIFYLFGLMSAKRRYGVK